MREILQTVAHDSSTYNDTNSLLNLNLMAPTQLNQRLTKMWGKSSDLFPLTMLTEGMGNTISKKAINGGDTQYKYKVEGKPRMTSQMVRLVTVPDANGKVGEGGSPIIIHMADNFFRYQYGVVLPNGRDLLRINTEGRLLASGAYEFKMVSQTGRGVSADLLKPGTWLGLGATTIAASKSDGTSDRKSSFSELTNQFGFHRFSQNIAGNIDNKICNIELEIVDNNTGASTFTKRWMPYQMKLWELERKRVLEEDLWISRYNRDLNGNIGLIDPDTNEPIPRGAGIIEQIEAVGNDFTFSNLSTRFLDMVIDRIDSNFISDSTRDKVLYCGKGFQRMFHEALNKEAVYNQYFTRLGEAEIKELGLNKGMSYGNYFVSYRTIHGTILTLMSSNMFDKGSIAEMQIKNQQTINGLPFNSYSAICLDHSMTNSSEYGNVSNIQMVYEDGRDFKYGIYKGMSEIPSCWGSTPGAIISDRKDIASYEVITSQGVIILNAYSSFMMNFAA